MPTWFFRIAAAILLLTAPLAHSQQAPTKLTGVAPSSQLRSYTKSPSAKKRIETSVGDFALWVDEAKWKQDKSDTAGVLEFSNLNGGVIVKVIAEDTGIATEGLRELVLTNARNAAPNAKITFEENRIVNGRQVLALQMAATVKGIPVKYFGYYHGGTSGTVQVIGVLVGSAFSDNNIEGVTEFLNGLEISDEDLPPTGILYPGLLRFNSKISVKYDPNKWDQQEVGPDDPEDLHFADDDAKAEIVAENISIPMDAFPKFVLSNAQDVDQHAKLISKKICRVNGVKVWFLKLTYQENTTPTIAFAYCYSGKAGTVQVVMSVEKSLLSKYEKDFMEFLNGLLVSE